MLSLTINYKIVFHLCLVELTFSMKKLMKAINQDYQVIPKQIEKVTPQQQTLILKRKRFKTICRSVGLSLFTTGMSLFYFSKKEQEKYQCPWWNIKETPPLLVTTGPYRYSRNPMYLSYITMYTSLGIFFLNWIFIALPCFGVGMLAFNFYNDTYIPIEEDKLSRTFGHQYVIYKTITPKWIGLPRKIKPQSGDSQYQNNFCV